MKQFIVTLVAIISLSSSLLVLNSEAQWVRVINANTGSFSKVVNYNGNILASYDKVYKTTDLGQTWSLFYDANFYGVNSLSVLNGNVWVGNFYNNIYTTNGGLNWTTVNLSHYVYDFISYNSRIFAGTESNKCYYTDNGGVNWGQCSDIWDDVMCLESSGSYLLAGTSQGIYYTTNNGANWLASSSIGTFDILYKGAFSFAATMLGIWSSTNNGMSWIQTSFGNNGVKSLESYNQNIFAGSILNGFYVSSNNGANWTQRNEGIGNVTITSLAIAGNTIFAATESAGIWKRPLSEIVSIQNISTEIPSSYLLSQNYPNPFNPMTNVKFSIVKAGDVKVVVYDIQGKEVQTLVNEKLNAGTYEVKFDGSSLNSGVYFYKMEVRHGGSSTGDFTETKRMILIK